MSEFLCESRSFQAFDKKREWYQCLYMRVILKSRTVDFYIILIDFDIFRAEQEKYEAFMIYP